MREHTCGKRGGGGEAHHCGHVRGARAERTEVARVDAARVNDVGQEYVDGRCAH